jgi:hypothetical protein
VEALNKFAGTSINATGVVFGSFAALGAHLYNTFIVPFWNNFAALANFFGNIFNDPVAAVKVLFFDMAQTVIGYILNMAQTIEKIINKIPGVTVDIAGGLGSFHASIEQASQKVKDESGWVEYMGRLDFMDYSNAYNVGYDVGEDMDTTIRGLFDLGDIGGNLGDFGGAPPWIANDQQRILQEIADNTGSIAASIGNMRDYLAYMRDIAEREAINRFTTAEIKVDMTGMTNRIDSSMDVDGIVNQFVDGVTEAMESSAEGIHE